MKLTARQRRLITLGGLRNPAEWLLWAIGCLTLGLCAVSWGIRHAAAQQAVAQFASSAQTTPGAGPAGLATHAGEASPIMDKQLWSAQRIAAYKHSAQSLDARAARALLRIPRLRLEAPVFEGTDPWVLNRGLGRIPGTAPIGESGNLAIAGHRDSFFRVLKDIAKGDRIELVSGDGTSGYQVTDTWIVNPDAVNVLEPTGSDVITLVTCYPFYFVGNAPQRLIVRAAAIGAL